MGIGSDAPLDEPPRMKRRSPCCPRCRSRSLRRSSSGLFMMVVSLSSCACFPRASRVRPRDSSF